MKLAEVALPDFDFGLEPRTLAPNLKSLFKKFHIEKTCNRKKLDAA